MALTGATGVLGRLVAVQLVKDGYHVLALVRDPAKAKSLLPSEVEISQTPLEDPLLLRQGLTGCQGAIHAAALVSFSQKDYSKLLAANRDLTASMVDASLEVGVKCFVHISSVAAVPNPSADPRTSTPLKDFTGPYGYTKHLAEREVQRGQAEGVRCAILRPSVILARHPDEGRSSSSLIDSALKPNTVCPPGHVHIVAGSDVAEATTAALGRLLAGHDTPTGVPPIYLLDSGAVTYQELYKELRKAAGITKPTIQLPAWALGFAKPLLPLAKSFFKGPLPTARQLDQLLQVRTFGSPVETEKLLGRPLKGLEEAVLELGL